MLWRSHRRGVAALWRVGMLIPSCVRGAAWIDRTCLAAQAVRNFVQLCLEGYYDGTVFHRVIKDYLVQGGDPTGTGEGE